MSNYHNAVLLNESVEGLNVKPTGIYVDATYGGGGHSAEMLKRLGEGGVVVAFDQDEDAQQNLINDKRLKLINQNFKYLKNNLRLMGHLPVDGILADLGVSSHQFDTPERGFSIRFNAELDMRMDKRSKITAAHVLNKYSEEQILQMLKNYGEVEKAYYLTKEILAFRAIKKFKTTGDLLSVIEAVYSEKNRKKISAKVFQALRIEVNVELDALKVLLTQSAEVLKEGGRLVIISYHSLEDRLVKNFMKAGNFEGEIQKDFFGNQQKPFKALPGMPIVPNEIEISNNPRSRSAKLRIAEKL